MYNEITYGLGSKRSSIREIFEYAKARAEVIGKENVHDLYMTCGAAAQANIKNPRN